MTILIIVTHWKRPQKNSTSVSDLPQMYAYCRFWDAERAMFLYPGDYAENRFKKFETDDYSLDQENTHIK